MFRLWGADVLSYNLVPEVSLAREMGICYSGLVTVSATAADRTAPAPHGELRASLSSTVQMLPALAEMLSAPPHCSCQRRK
jgi:purine nucleoside phosphorylase